jgi:hypothetical protein
VQWKKICVETNDQYVVFADIINKITRSSGKVTKNHDSTAKKKLQFVTSVAVCANLVCVVDQFHVDFGPANPSNQIQGAGF